MTLREKLNTTMSDFDKEAEAAKWHKEKEGAQNLLEDVKKHGISVKIENKHRIESPVASFTSST
jgi:hypothetical protein